MTLGVETLLVSSRQEGKNVIIVVREFLLLIIPIPILKESYAIHRTF